MSGAFSNGQLRENDSLALGREICVALEEQNRDHPQLGRMKDAHPRRPSIFHSFIGIAYEVS